MEAETAAIARNYLRGTPILINYLNGEWDLDKPPLYYWIVALCGRFVPNWELAARLPSIISIFIFVYLFYLITKEQNNKQFLFLWIFIFLACPKVFWMSQIARMDPIFSATCFGGLFLFYKIVKNYKETSQVSSSLRSIFFIISGISVMIKGPIGAIFIFVPCLVFLFLNKEKQLIKELFLSKYFILFFLIFSPWYFYAIIKTNFSFFIHFFLKENLCRFTTLIPFSTLKEFNHSPFDRYFIYLFVGFFPWSLLIPLWIFYIFKKWYDSLDIIEAIFLIYFFFIFIFLTLSLSKRSDYILPIYPIIAFFTTKLLIDNNKYLKSIFIIFAILLIIISFFLLGLYFNDISFLKIYTLNKTYSLILQSFYPYLVLWSILLLIIGCFLLRYCSNISRLYIIIGILFMIISFGPLHLFYKEKDLRPFCKKIDNKIKNNPVYFLEKWDEQIAFYMDRPIKKIFLYQLNTILKENKQKTYLIIDGKKLKDLKALHIPFQILIKSDTIITSFILISL